MQLATPPLVLSNVRCSEVLSAALNVPSMALVPSIGHQGCSRHPRTPFPPIPVPAGHPFRRLHVGIKTALLAMRQVAALRLAAQCAADR